MPPLSRALGRATGLALQRSPVGRVLAPLATGEALAAAARALGHEERPARHPLAPAAVRIERTTLRRAGERGDQYAVTMWFGEGPSLPAPSPRSSALRTAGRLGGTVIAAAALAAATTVAARLEQPRRRQQIVDTTATAVEAEPAAETPQG